MSKSLFEHDFQKDLEENENTYCTQDIQWQYINDNNQGNYSNGYINFTNLNLSSGSIDKMYSFSNAYITVPYTIALYGDGNVNGFKFTVDAANAYAACLKSSTCIVDWVSAKFDGAQLTRSSYHNHLMMNEKIKTYNADKYKLYGDVMGHAWDNGHSINYVPAGLGETNNHTFRPHTMSTGLAGLAPANITNDGHFQRCMKNNIDVTRAANSSLNKFLTLTDSPNTSIRDTEHQNVLVFQDADTLIFHGTAIIPLSELHDVFREMPTVSTMNGFDLRLQCNIARENTYSINYPAITGATGIITPTAVNVIQSIGKVCPVMVPFASVEGQTGLRYIDGTQGTGILNIKCAIGWGKFETLPTGMSQNANSVAASNSICRIHVPTISFTSDYIKDIANSPQYSLKFNDYYVDSDLNQKQGSTVSRLFNTQLTRARILYIIPFLAQSTVAGKTYPSALTSPFSSAPTTCTPCRLKNLNISIGGSWLFSEPQNYNYNFFNNNALSIVSDINGNSLKGNLFSGQISKSMWENGYNVTYVNLEKVSDISLDSAMKQFQLSYTIEGTNTDVYYDMYYIISYQNEINLDRLTGKVTSINQQ